ncbi:MAG: PaaI family thioesterase [Thiotrichales bacterium]|nr:PaaI family thioesterase [Thiotrichales bacterium]
MPESIGNLKEDGNFPSFSRAIPYAGFIQMDVEMEDGNPITVLRKDPGNIGNPLVPMIHGGAVGALLEHAALMQLFFELELGLDRAPKIVNISIDYLRPSLLEDTFARGFIIRQGRRVANVRVEAWQSDRERLVAAAHAHFLLPGD